MPVGMLSHLSGRRRRVPVRLPVSSLVAPVELRFVFVPAEGNNRLLSAVAGLA